MTDAPQNPNEGRLSNGAFAANDGGNGDDVVGVSGMAHPQKETNRENGQSAGHDSCGIVPLRVTPQQLVSATFAAYRRIAACALLAPCGKRLFTVAQDAHQLRGGMRQARSAPRYQVHVAGQAQLPHLYFFHPTAFNLPLHTHTRHDRHAHAHLHKALDAFDGGHFNGHIERGAVPGEKLDDPAAKWRLNDVPDEGFVGKIFDVHLPALGQRMFQRHHQGQLVLQDFRSLQLRIARNIRDCADVQTIVQHFVRNISRKHSMNAHLNARMHFAEFGERGKQGMDGAFVDAQGQLPALQPLQLAQALFYFVAQVQQALGVIFQKDASVGQAYRARAAHKQWLAQRIFQLANTQADGWLGAI